MRAASLRGSDAIVVDGNRDGLPRRSRTRGWCCLAGDARLQSVVEQVAEHGFDHFGIAVQPNALGNRAVDVDAASGRFVRNPCARGGHQCGQRHRFAAHFQPSFLNARRIEQVVDHAEQPVAVFEQALAQAPAVGVCGAQCERLCGKAHTRQGALELVRDRSKKVLLTAAQLRIVADGAGEHGHAAEQHKQKEAPLQA